jgi:hypothetical protein
MKKGTDSVVPSFLKSQNESLNKCTKRPESKNYDPKIDDISKYNFKNY